MEFVFPAVFTQEFDKSFLQTGIESIGTGFVGTTKEGPAFLPTIISNQTEFDTVFGGSYDKSYLPFAVKSYLKNGSSAVVVRVLGNEAWNTNNFSKGCVRSTPIYVSASAGLTVAAVLLPTANSASVGEPGQLHISGSVLGATRTSTREFYIITGSVSMTCSLDPASPYFIAKQFSTDPNTRNGNDITTNWYLYQYYGSEYSNSVSSSTSTSIVGGDIVSSSGASFSSSVAISTAAYSKAYTPFITSQLLDTSGQTIDLFKFGTIDDGIAGNRKVKVVISQIKKPVAGSSEYGSFTVTVRKYDDTDEQQVVYESFSNCNLDPNSSNYICRQIGTQVMSIDATGKVSVSGDWPNKSKYIYVIPGAGLGNLSNTLVPFGHQMYKNTFVTVTGSVAPVVFRLNQGDTSVYNNRYSYGIDLTNSDNKNFNNPLATGVVNANAKYLSNNTASSLYNTTSGSKFNLDYYFGHASSSLYTGSLSGSSAPTEMLKFMVTFQGGYDGMPLNRPIGYESTISATNVFGFDCSNATGTSTGINQYKLAFKTLSNADEYDIKELVFPGICESLHPAVTALGRNVATDRGGDCHVVFELTAFTDTVSTATSQADVIDTSYASAYYPWVKVIDPSNQQYRWVPASAIIPSVYAYNDRVGGEQFAPAGMNRGGIEEAVDVKDRVSQPEKEALYSNRVNPIILYRGRQVQVWGQKTLQKKASALDRINVRRLLIRLKKFVSSTSRYLVFEPNVRETQAQFLSLVNPYLQYLKSNKGVYDAIAIMDSTNNTPDVIDRNILKGAIYLKPTKAAEYIVIDFNILPTGASFPTV